MQSDYKMNLRNERNQIRDTRFVTYSRKRVEREASPGFNAASITLSDVARMAGVSNMTVSRVLNGSAKVSAGKMDRVKSAISMLQYRPNEHAINLRRGNRRGLQKGQIQVTALLLEESVRQLDPLDEVFRSSSPIGQKTLSEDEYARVSSLLSALNENLKQLARIIR